MLDFIYQDPEYCGNIFFLNGQWYETFSNKKKIPIVHNFLIKNSQKE